MRHALLAALILALTPCVVSAQASIEYKSHGYLYVAPGLTGESEGTIHLGGGWERFFGGRAGLGLDGGYLGAFKDLPGGIGTFSTDFVGQLRARSNHKVVEPFLTGGHTLFFRDGFANGANFGGGFNWWCKEKLGLRVEARNHLLVGGGEGALLLEFRVGILFR